MNPKATILLVEDDQGIARLERSCLERAGYAVVTAESADRAYHEVRSGAIDLILLDQRLPSGVDGLSFYRQLKQAGFDVPAILVTGLQDEILLVEAMRAGIRDFVPKTLNFLNHLEPIITRVLGQVATERELIASQIRARETERRQRELEFEIAERKRIEQQLRESETRYRELAESLPLFVWSCGPNGAPEYTSKRWYEYTGSSVEFDKTQSGLGFIHPEDRVHCTERWNQAVATGLPFECEVRIRNKDGGYRWFVSRAVPIRSEEGVVVRWIGSTSDIDDVKRMQEELREADRRKDEFLAMLAHELRNPLAPIYNAAQILRREGRESEHFDWSMTVIENQIEHLARLVDDLLDVARINEGKVVLKRERVRLDRIVHQAVQTCRPLMESLSHRFRVEMGEEPIWVEADPARLAQVLSNLLNNAAKYTDPGGAITLAVEARNDEVYIRVRDNGIGIPPELINRVFDLFTQAEQTLSRSHGGLGIGLTLVRTLVELHGGRVSARSDGPGCGSEFTVVIPRIPSSEEGRGGPAPGDDRPESGNLDLPRRRILIVDDNRGNVQGLAILLKFFGQEVLTVYDGRTALEQLPALGPDIVLLDIGLPDIDGYEVLRRCRHAPSLRSTRFIAMTGYGQEEDRLRSLDAGFTAHLVKPVNVKQLRQLLTDLLESDS